MKSVIIVDDHPIFRASLRIFLRSEFQIETVAEAGDGSEVPKLLDKIIPDLILLDYAMTCNGIETLRLIQHKIKDTKVILLTAEIESNDILESIRLGVRGVVLKTQVTAILRDAINTVVDGNYWFENHAITNIAQFINGKTPQPFRLTDRELQVIQAVVESCSNKEIAEKLQISEDTVKHHMSNIFNKTGVSRRMELAFFAMKYHLQPKRNPNRP